MKRLFLSAAFFCLFLAGAVFAQTDKTSAANFAGTWELDVAKSKLPERMRVESGTLVVAQADKQLSVTTGFKRSPRPENQPPADGNNNDGGGSMRPEGGRGGMRGGGGMMGGGNGTATYNLDGKETTVESETPAGMPPSSLKLKAEFEKDGKLKLISNRSIETQTGAMTVKTVDVWELLDGGKTLKIERETETPRGSQSAEMYFTKKDSVGAAVNSTGEVYKDTVERPVSGGNSSIITPPLPAGAQEIKTIEGGVLNGKALVLAQPKYPKEARKEKIGGTVSVKIKIDEQGNVVSAKLVSGDSVFADVCEEAARNSKFTPTTLEGKPVKVTGIITYNFIL